MRALDEKEAIIIINRFKGITTAPVNTEEVREACALAIAALNKQVPREPGEHTRYWATLKTATCPRCKYDVLHGIPKFCSHCGQALDWSEKNERI